ncbi:MAG: galactokinase [Verrucomicrobiales bacterium]
MPNPPTFSQRGADASAKLLRATFGAAPRWIAQAPGRVNVIGEHVDYNGGFVLPAAIDRYATIAAAPLDEPVARIASADADGIAEIPLDREPEPGADKWANYLRGAAAGFLRRGIAVPGFCAAITSTVPLGGGLSSSASFEVSFATLLNAVSGAGLNGMAVAEICQRGDHEFVGVPCGIMDQAASANARAGHLMLLDCRSLAIRHIPMADPSVALLICDTRVKHDLSDGAYAQRRAACEEAARAIGVELLRDADAAMLEAARDRMSGEAFRRARHVVAEIPRTLEAVAAIEAGDWSRAGRLMFDSHESLRGDYEVSCAELDAAVEIAADIGECGGIYGARMTGGGFGGCAVALVKAERAAEVGEALALAFESRCGHAPGILITPPAAGAQMIS